MSMGGSGHLGVGENDILWVFSAPSSCLFHKGLSSPWQSVIRHHKGFYLAVSWLMSLEF